MTETFVYAALVAVFVEILVYFLAPKTFLHLAQLPAGLKRRVELPVPTLEKLTAHIDTDPKGRVRRQLDLARVAWPTVVRTGALVGRATKNGAWVRVQQVGWLPQGWAVARVVGRQRRDDIVLKARFVPVPFLAPLLLLAALGGYVATHEAAVGAAFCAGLVLGGWGALVLAARAQLRPLLGPVLAQLEATIAARPDPTAPGKHG